MPKKFEQPGKPEEERVEGEQEDTLEQNHDRAEVMAYAENFYQTARVNAEKEGRGDLVDLLNKIGAESREKAAEQYDVEKELIDSKSSQIIETVGGIISHADTLEGRKTGLYLGWADDRMTQEILSQTYAVLGLTEQRQDAERIELDPKIGSYQIEVPTPWGVTLEESGYQEESDTSSKRLRDLKTLSIRKSRYGR